MYDLSKGLLDCQSNFLDSQNTIDDLNFKITQLNTELTKYKSSTSTAAAPTTNCNFITICKMKNKSNFNYEQVGCTATVPLEQYVQTVKNQNEAIDIARTYGATVFCLTSKNELYIGFSYDARIITQTNLCGKDQTIKLFCAIPTIQSNPTMYGYPYYCSYKLNSSSTEFKNAVNTIFNNLDNKYNVGKASNLDDAVALANKYGATGYFIDINSNVYITYNFYRPLIQPTLITKSSSSSIKETIYFTPFRTLKVQFSHKNCA
jgi:hypothetical protein